MPVSAGVQLGPYELLAPIAAGGMGEVYRARDPRLGREVAIKILPSEFSANPDRVRRFEQEARAAGILNHPNILTIYDVGYHDDTLFVVSELLVGETLRQKIGGHPLPVRKAVDYALQAAHGLAAAHDKGIIHRDLKPENVFVTRDGRVKILDFGLAKLTGGGAGTEFDSALPTADPGTQPGIVLGTVGYMSPEQVRGQEVDQRSDIFALGTILYEMLTGARAFVRDTNAETMTAILKEDPPDLSRTGLPFPPSLERVVRHCLEKNPEERFQTARDLAFQLDLLSGISAADLSTPVAVPQRHRPWKRTVIAGSLMLLIGIVFGFLAAGAMSKRAVSVPASFRTLTFQRGYVSSARFAPDGQTIIYSASWNGKPRELFSTRQDIPASRTLGLNNTDLLSVSSNGELAVLVNAHYIAGWERLGTLARVPVDGGAPRAILDNVQDADWAPDGTSLAVSRMSGRDYVLEFPIGKVLYRTSGWINGVRVSPRGDGVAFLEHLSGGDDRGKVVFVNAQGEKKALTEVKDTVIGLAWRNSREVWYSGAAGLPIRQIAVQSVTLSGDRRTVSTVAGPMVLQDVSRNGDVLFTVENRRRDMIALPPGASKEVDLSWFNWSFPHEISDDGKWVLFEEQGQVGGSDYSIFIRQTDGSPPVRLGDGMGLALSSDHQWVLSSLPRENMLPVLLPTGVGEAKALNIRGVNLGLYARWFADGKRLLLFGAQPGHDARYWIYSLQSGKLSPASPEGLLAPALISRDQKLFLAKSTAGIFGLYPVGGGSPRTLPFLGNDDSVVGWAVDGQSVYVAHGDHYPLTVDLLNLSTGRRTQWKVINPMDPAGIQEVAPVLVAPDGNSYVYSYRRVLSELFLGRGIQ